MDISHMTPCRPFLLRAYYAWLMHNQLTPYLLVNAMYHGVQVPIKYVQNGKIILNIASNAVINLNLGDDKVCFNSRFGGISHYVSVPIHAVQAIYAHENGAGSLFESEFSYEMKGFIEDQKNNDYPVKNLIAVTDEIKQKNDNSDEIPLSNGCCPILRLVK